MMKAILLAGAAIAASPVLAQDAKPSATTEMSAPATEQAAPTTPPATPEAAPPMSDSAPAATQPTQAQPAPATPAQDSAQTTATPATPAEAPAQTAAAEPAPTAAQPATDATQVAAVIDADFGKYDANKDGNLSKDEFGAWMVALKKASDPATDAASTETTTWVGKAFAQADTDKSAAISKPELNKFLAPQAG